MREKVCSGLGPWIGPLHDDTGVSGLADRSFDAGSLLPRSFGSSEPAEEPSSADPLRAKGGGTTTPSGQM